MGDRKFFVGGNWKMNGNKASIDGIVEFLNKDGLNANTGMSKKKFQVENLAFYR